MNLNLVRATYWLAAIIDALAAVQLLLPRSATFLGFEGQRAAGAAGQPAIVAAVLMLGFSAILIWAHLRTVDRRAILAITLAVVLTLATSNVILGASGTLPWSKLAPPLVIQTVLAALFSASIVVARREAARREAVR